MSHCRRVIVLVVGLLLLAGMPTAWGQVGKPEPLPESVRAAWQKAGAKVGWMAVHKTGFFPFRVGNEGKAGEMPAFRLSPWQDGVLARLPSPQRGFGLDLSGSKVTDAGLKELAALKHLQWLDLDQTKVTDAGLKELAALKQLQTLSLSRTKVTDAGL
ncbi:MAG: hypothetical protein L0Z62_37355, partial [Gemmataceae bacterium]|nr:hypothetical protein [Gemmataceae bacterium]